MIQCFKFRRLRYLRTKKILYKQQLHVKTCRDLTGFEIQTQYREITECRTRDIFTKPFEINSRLRVGRTSVKTIQPVRSSDKHPHIRQPT